MGTKKVKAKTPRITKGGETIKVINATDKEVYLLIYVRDINRDWHSLKIKVPRERFKSMG